MQIKVLDENREGEWDAFVETCPEAGFFHKAGWKRVVEQALGHPQTFLYAEAAGRIVGVLPLGQVKSLLFGNALISSPFCVYGGVAAESPEARQALEAYAVRMAHELQVDYLEFRNRVASGSGRPTKSLYVTFRKTLDPNPDQNMNAVPRKQRAMIRKGIAAGLSSVIDTGVDRFYDAYAESVRNLGTPVFPKRLFILLKQVFGEACEILTVEYQGRPVASVMNFYFRDQVLPYYGGGIEQARDLKANDFMYWEVMRRAVEKGVRVFDFGRSKEGTGSYRFKTHWGFEPEPLPYEYELVRAGKMPDINPLNPKYRLFVAAWRHLPVPMSKLVGPWIARNLG
ncbi:FemAB-related protein, PEP-CTERM system-associated [Methylomagnum ishizawai]|uniref:FemAB-related protein, PEP-CTERM system-associated n=1 Tax=Methylomagnum ishizawai TaxID=1760988 RepID=A0A1Y6D2X8_9GAMM|nr:FemAB family XrtA/PEP-CTERM system-associated protein [Methylomagnum ishizawai]SMF94734.1 FemAB-related protein, PEP-CTERM system-associated [Methylomagnum ishizawai]